MAEQTQAISIVLIQTPDRVREHNNMVVSHIIKFWGGLILELKVEPVRTHGFQ